MLHMRAVDLHLHLLPGVDDGARDLAESLGHARRLAAAGVVEATVTPHVSPDVEFDVCRIPVRTAALQAELDAARIPLRLHPGGELHPRRAATITDAELEVIAHGPPGARWVVLEAPCGGIASGFVALGGPLGERGASTVIAPPGRASHGLE